MDVTIVNCYLMLGMKLSFNLVHIPMDIRGMGHVWYITVKFLSNTPEIAFSPITSNRPLVSHIDVSIINCVLILGMKWSLN